MNDGHTGTGPGLVAPGCPGVARRRQLGSVLVPCDEGNAASARVIEKLGGLLEDVRDTPVGRKRRYWIAA